MPAGTPEPIVAKLNTEITKVLAMPDVKERLGGELTTGPAAFAALIKTDHDKWAGVIKDAGIKAQ